MTIYEILGDHLLHLRGRRTQTEFAEELGFSQSYYARLEKGEGRLQLHQLAEITAKLNLTVIISEGNFKILTPTKADI